MSPLACHCFLRLFLTLARLLYLPQTFCFVVGFCDVLMDFCFITVRGVAPGSGVGTGAGLKHWINIKSALIIPDHHCCVETGLPSHLLMFRNRDSQSIQSVTTVDVFHAWIEYYCTMGWFIIFVTKCLTGGSSHVDFPESEQSTNDDTTDVSLITGALRASSLRSSSEPTDGAPLSSSVVVRNQTLTVANTNTAGNELWEQQKYVHTSTQWNNGRIYKRQFVEISFYF